MEMMQNEPEPIDETNLIEANTDFMARVAAVGIDLIYDEDGDILLVTFGEPQEATSEPTSFDWLYVRISPETLEIVGLDVLQFRRRVLANNEIVRQMFAGQTLDTLLAGQPVHVEGTNAQKAASLIRELATAQFA